MDGTKTGFSFLEIILVLAVLAVLLGVTLPKLSNHLARLNAKHTAQDIAESMRLAKNHAVAKRASVEVMLCVTQNRIAKIQVGHNLNLDGSSGTSTTILEEYPIENRLSITTSPSTNVRKIIFQPFDHVLLTDSNGDSAATQNLAIQIKVETIPAATTTVFYKTGESVFE